MTSGDFELSLDELRAVTAYAVACAEPTLGIAHEAMPDDPRPSAASATPARQVVVPVSPYACRKSTG